MREAGWAPWLSSVTSSTPPVRKYNNSSKHDTHYSLITHLPVLRHTDISRQVRSKLFSLPKSRDSIYVCVCAYKCWFIWLFKTLPLLVPVHYSFYYGEQEAADSGQHQTADGWPQQQGNTHVHTLFYFYFFLTIMLLDGWTYSCSCVLLFSLSF